MNSEVKSLRRLSEEQYSSIGRTVCLITTIEYELFRTISVVAGITQKEEISAARGTFDQRKTMLREKLKGDARFKTDSLDDTFSKLDVVSQLRGQFAHGLWVTEEGQLVGKFVKRHTRDEATKHVALRTMKVPPKRFELIHRNLENILIELNVIQELLIQS